MNQIERVIDFRNIMRRMERVVLSRIKDSSYCCGVTVNQGHILLCLEGKEDVTLTNLNDELRLDKASLSRTVDTLVKKGLVNRESRSDDRRSQNLGLTEEGKQYVERINRASLDSFGRIFEGLEKDIRERISSDLHELVEAMRSEGNVNNGCTACKGEENK